MENRVLARQPLVLPDAGGLSPVLAASLDRTDVALRYLTPLSAAFVLEAPDALFAGLEHPLSSAYIHLHGQDAGTLRSCCEAEALASLYSSGLSLHHVADEATFQMRLAKINALCGEDGRWRTGQVGTSRDRRGRQVVFPPPDQVPELMGRLRRFLGEEQDRRPALFKAAFALALLTNCHPFKDGNGRVARVLFNHVLHGSGMPRAVYVPFAELASRSRGGYEIALRQGEIQRRWGPFLSFCAEVMDLHQRLAAQAREVS